MAKDSFIQIARVSEKMTEETEKEILRAYKTAQKDIKKQLSDLYTKYEKDGVLTYSEMAKYNRLDGMLKDINSTVNNTSINSGNKIKKLSRNVFENSYYQAGYTIEGMADAKLSFSLLHRDAIQASVENPIAGLTLSETLQKNRKQVITNIKQSVTQGLVMGESYKKMADRMTSALNNDATKALRVARTEAHRNQNAGTLKAVDHAVGRGVKLKKEWIATLDDRTRDTHASMDGQIVDSDKNFVSPSGARGPAPGMLGSASEDINCRCALGTILPGADETTNRQTYEEWAESRSIPVPKEVAKVYKKTTKQISIEDNINKLKAVQEKEIIELEKLNKKIADLESKKIQLGIPEDLATNKELKGLSEAQLHKKIEKLNNDISELQVEKKIIRNKIISEGGMVTPESQILQDKLSALSYRLDEKVKLKYAATDYLEFVNLGTMDKYNKLEKQLNTLYNEKLIINNKITAVRKDLSDLGYTNKVLYKEISEKELTTNAKKIFSEFTIKETDVIREYTSMDYMSINDALRRNKIMSVSSDTRNSISVLDDIFKKVPEVSDDITVYRGMSDTAENIFKVKNLSELNGTVFIDKGFVSTSVTQEVAQGFGEFGITVKIQVPKGSKVLPVNGFSDYAGEREMLFPRDSIFEIVGAKSESGNTIIEALYKGVAK